ncbi:ABC transporter ATP-binding protein [Microbacterium oxydans]|nr:ABC transporter ATP-binding protein [Microbacterium oxydans]
MSGTLAAIATTALAGMSAWFAAEGRISIGELVTVLGLAQFISGYLSRMRGRSPSNWIHKLASAKRLAEMIDAEDLLDPPPASPASGRSGRTVVLAFHTDSGSPRVEVRERELLGVRPADSDTARALSRMLGLRTRVDRGRVHLAVDGELRDLADPTRWNTGIGSSPLRMGRRS